MALDSWEDVKAWILTKAEENDNGTSDFDTEANTALLEAWRDLYTRHPWLSMRSEFPAALILPVAVTSLTVTAAAGTSVVGALSTIYTPSLRGWHFLPDGASYVIRVTSHVAGTAVVTLDAVPVALAAQSGRFVQVEFDLPANFALFVSGWYGSDKYFIPVRDLETVRLNYPDPPTAGYADGCTRLSVSKVRFTHYSEIVRRIEAPYSTIPNLVEDTSTLVLEAHLRAIFADLGLHYLYEAKGDMTRMQQVKVRAEEKIERAIAHEMRMIAGLGRASRAAKPGPYGDNRRRRRRW